MVTGARRGGRTKDEVLRGAARAPRTVRYPGGGRLLDRWGSRAGAAKPVLSGGSALIVPVPDATKARQSMITCCPTCGSRYRGRRWLQKPAARGFLWHSRYFAIRGWQLCYWPNECAPAFIPLSQTEVQTSSAEVCEVQGR